MSVDIINQLDTSLMDDIWGQYQDQRGALIPILQKAQEVYGYLPPEVLKLIARRMGLPLSKVYGVATFYAQFYLEPRGRHILKLCDGTACHVKGTPVLATAVEEHYGIHPGQTSEDGELTVEIVYCLGSCALAPVVILNNEVMGRMRQQMLLRTLSKSIKSAQTSENS